MRKRTAKIQEFVTANNGKPLCAKISPKTHSIIASGDDKNAISIWRLNKDRPLVTLSSQGVNQNVSSEVSAICFNVNEHEVFSGTNRGTISVWDVQNQKLITTLKGHAASINCISTFGSPGQDHLILTGSNDFSIKLWDLRQKQSVAAFKGHHMQVNCVESTPDGKWFASGSQDSLIKLWDIAAGKCIQTFNLHEAPITCMKFNPYDLTLATGSADKTIKYWDLEAFKLICSTKTESTAIQSLSFDMDGKYLFSAAQDIMRVWYVDADDLKILDNVEATWRGVQDLALQTSSKSEEENLIGVAITSVSFGLWCCPLKTVNKDPSITPEKFYQMRKQLEAKMKPVTQSQEMDQPFIDIEKPQSKPKPVSDPSVRVEHPQHTPSPQRDIGKHGNLPANVFIKNAQNNLLPSGYPSLLTPNPMSGPQQMGQMGQMGQVGQQSGINFYEMGPYGNNPMFASNILPQSGFPVQQMGQMPNHPGQYINPQYYNINQGQPQEPINLQSPIIQDSLQNQLAQHEAGLKRNNSIPKEPVEKKKVNEIQVHDAGLMAKLQENGMNEEKLPLREEDSNSNLKEATISIIEVNKADPAQLNLSSFMGGGDNKEKSMNFDAISDMTKDHSKFKAFMTQRLNHLELVLHYWNSGNVRSALQAINILNLNDSTLLMDLLNMSTAALNKTGQLNVEAACIFLQKAVMLVESKFDHHVKMGFQFILKTFRQFHDELLKIKTANVMNMVDLAREERLKKYDKLINEFESIINKERIKKLAIKNKDEIGQLANQVLTDLELFLEKVKTGGPTKK